MSSRIGHKVTWLQSVNSTNDYAAELAKAKESHGQVVVADNQEQGRGQRGNSWESRAGENLLLSIALKPRFLEVQNQFRISKITALAICDVISKYTKGVTIKWPNDIYIGNSKVAGILIENSFQSEFLDTTIVGIGINVNQTQFSDDIPNPTSLRLATSSPVDRKILLEQVTLAVDMRYSRLTNQFDSNLNIEYFKRLYRIEGYSRFAANGADFMAKITGVKDSGELLLETENGEIREFAFKEVQFII